MRLADLNNDGYIDIIQGRESTAEKKAWLNNKTGWNLSLNLAPPEYFLDGVGNDKGLRIADLNNDGLPDLIQGIGATLKAWLNNVTGWVDASSTWSPPIAFVDSDSRDQGVQLADINGDGKVDLLQATKEGPDKKSAYLNNGSGWKDASSQWVSPVFFLKFELGPPPLAYDYGARLVDVNGDGLVDILQAHSLDGGDTKSAWLNNGSGWTNGSAWLPPDIFTSSSKGDNGVRFIDVNGDGLTDILEDLSNGSANIRSAWINTGRGWTNVS